LFFMLLGLVILFIRNVAGGAGHFIIMITTKQAVYSSEQQVLSFTKYISRIC